MRNFTFFGKRKLISKLSKQTFKYLIYMHFFNSKKKILFIFDKVFNLFINQHL
jgi:hypothetical protein